jgi:DNA-binding NarL/FixJ family response regulator
MLLLVEDDPLVARAVERILQKSGEVRVARTLAEAHLHLESIEDPAGMVLDVGLPDGDGLALLKALRQQRPWFPVLVYTATFSKSVVDQMYLLRAYYAQKPALDRLPTFASECTSRATAVASATVATLARQKGLSPTEAALLLSKVLLEPREDYLARADIAASTYKTHVEHLRDKLGSSLSDVVATLQRRLLKR